MSTRHIPRITAELPNRWSSVETAELFGPDGVQVRVTAQPVAPEMDTAGLAERHRIGLAEQVAGFRDGGVEEIVAFGGHPALIRRTSFGGEMGPSRGLAAYLVHAGFAYVVSATGPAGGFEAHESEVLTILDDLLILGRPLSTVPTEEDGDQAAPTRVPAVPHPSLRPAAWEEARKAWSEPSNVERSSEQAFELSEEELLVLASVVGCGTFPSVDPMILGALARTERESTARAIVRSLVTRGALVDTDGRLRPAREWESLVDLALYPDLHVEVVVGTGTDSCLTVLCVRPDGLVQTSPVGAFGRRVTSGRAEDLVEIVIDRSGIASAPAVLGATRQCAVEDLARTVKVRTTWRDGTALVGGELRWAVTPDGELGAVDDIPGSGVSGVVLRPTDLDEVRAQILTHLPGARPSGGDRSP